MRYIYSYLTIFIFAAYWFITLIFVSPHNFIKISLVEGEEMFNMLLFQQWGFFAPPPKYNDRLYYTFKNKKDSSDIKVFEVIEPLQRIKSANAPFNSSENILDYVLSSTINSVSDGIFAINEVMDYQKEIDSTVKVTDSIRFDKNKAYTQSTGNFQTLKNYSYLVADRNNINLKDYSIKIDIAQVRMPKFADRNASDSLNVLTESIIFSSDEFTHTEK